MYLHIMYLIIVYVYEILKIRDDIGGKLAIVSAMKFDIQLRTFELLNCCDKILSSKEF